MRRFFFLVVLAALVAAGAIAFALLAPTGPETATYVDILPGTPSAQIAGQLKQQGIIRSKWIFLGLRVARGGTLKAGEYRFDHPVPMTEVWEKIRRGEVYTVEVTIPEGSNIFDIAARVEAAGLGSKASVLAAAKQDASMVQDLDPQAPSLEGYLFPDTYRFSMHTDPQEMMMTMVKRFRAAV